MLRHALLAVDYSSHLGQVGKMGHVSFGLALGKQKANLASDYRKEGRLYWP